MALASARYPFLLAWNALDESINKKETAFRKGSRLLDIYWLSD